MLRSPFLFILAFLAAIAPCAAQPNDEGGRRPNLAQRVVHVFDFEEQDTNPWEIPLHWVRAQDDPNVPRDRPGYPRFNKAKLDYTVAARGEGSLHLPTDGGSTSLRLKPGNIVVFPMADYLVSAKVRTDGLKNARAVLIARFLDNNSQPIPGSESRSDLVNSRGRWLPVSAELLGEFPDAAFLQIDLELLQQSQFMTSRLGAHQVWNEDIGASVWFDDVAIVQLPRIEIKTQDPANIIAKPESPVIELMVRDLTGQKLRMELEVQDIDGNVIDRHVENVAAEARRAHWEPDLRKLGWYRVVLDLFTGDQRVGTNHLDFIWLPRPAQQDSGNLLTVSAAQDAALPGRLGGGSIDHFRFGLVLSNVLPDQMELMPEIVKKLGTGSITLPVWKQDLTLSEIPTWEEQLIPPVESLLAQWQSVTFSLSKIPSELAKLTQLDDDEILRLVSRPEEAWAPFLFPFLDKFGQSVQRWQFGAPTDSLAFWQDDLPQSFDAIEGQLSRFVPGPIVTLPWHLDQSAGAVPTAENGSAYALSALMPYELPAASLKYFASAHRQIVNQTPEESLPPELSLVFQNLPHEQFGFRAGVIDLVTKTVEFWNHFAGDDRFAQAPPVRAAVLDPWRTVGSRRPQLMPMPELAAWRTLVDQLSGRTIIGELPLAPGVKCYILAPRTPGDDDTGSLVAWRESGPPEEAVLKVYLGSGPITVVDTFGNQSRLELTPPQPEFNLPPDPRLLGAHSLKITDMPVFINGINVQIARFIASVRVDPPFAQADSEPHQHELILTNPWPVNIQGQIAIVRPGGIRADGSRDRGWEIAPRIASYSIAPSQQARIPFTTSFGSIVEAGSHQFVLDVDLVADQEIGRLRITTPLEVGLEHLNVTLSYRPMPTASGPNILVEANITNTGEEPITVEISARAPAFAKQRASVSDLLPSASITRRFSFMDSYAKLKGKRIVIQVNDTQSRRITKSIVIE